MKNKKLFYTFLTISILFFILILRLSLSGGEESSSQSSIFTDVIINIIPPIIDSSGNNIFEGEWFLGFVRKLFGHYGLFFAFAIFVNSTFLQTKIKIIQTFIFSFLVGLFTAVISELIQMIPQGRTASYIDVLIDSFGYLTCIIIFAIIILIVNKKKSKKLT